MIRQLFNQIYGSVPARFESRYSVPESISRLEKVVRPWSFRDFGSERAVGTITAERTSVRRVYGQNSFRPIFVGAFQPVGSTSVLIGRFTLARWVKFFLPAWLGVLAVFTVFITDAAITGSATTRWAPLFGVAMLGMGLGIARFGVWSTRNDIAWVSRVISEALGAPDSARNPLRTASKR
jgi:hypothetical protein